MKGIGNFIGGIITLFVFGAIVFGIFKEGHTVGIIVVISIALLIWFSVLRDDRRDEEEARKKEAITKAEIEEKKRIEKIESMTEIEFISFVKYNYNNLSEHFKDGGITKMGHGVEAMSWSTKKYIIKSEIDTNNFNEFISIYRKSDKAKIFSGVLGYDN